MAHNNRQHNHQPIVYQCWICGITYANWDALGNHRRTHTFSGKFVEKDRALHGTARSFEYDFAEEMNESDISKVFSVLHVELKQLLRTILVEGPHKISLVVAECAKTNDMGDTD